MFAETRYVWPRNYLSFVGSTFLCIYDDYKKEMECLFYMFCFETRLGLQISITVELKMYSFNFGGDLACGGISLFFKLEEKTFLTKYCKVA